jgi:Domain of unknown function (DUF4902)
MKTKQNSPSFDYYLRLTEAALRATVLEHIESKLDLDQEDLAMPDTARAPDGPLRMRGYTEWASAAPPTVSVGWDWVTTQPGQLLLDRSSFRTNVMLIDGGGADCGHEATVLALTHLVEGLDWKSAVLAALRAG